MIKKKNNRKDTRREIQSLHLRASCRIVGCGGEKKANQNG